MLSTGGIGISATGGGGGMGRNWYCRVSTAEGDWYVRFVNARLRDEFCEQTGAWVLRTPFHDWRGNLTGTRERIPADISPVTAAEVRRNEEGLPVRTY